MEKRLLLVLAVVAALLTGHAHASLGLSREQKATATRRLLAQLSALNLWSGAVACSNSAQDDVYEVSLMAPPQPKSVLGSCWCRRPRLPAARPSPMHGPGELSP